MGVPAQVKDWRLVEHGVGADGRPSLVFGDPVCLGFGRRPSWVADLDSLVHFTDIGGLVTEDGVEIGVSGWGLSAVSTHSCRLCSTQF